jgi:alkylation response protein AidB-like acyl-CoA dehydrogenase
MHDVTALLGSALDEACAAATSWPLPAGGRTAVRWAALSRLAGHDLVLARLVEAHADAVAILAELGGPSVASGERYGVWAAEMPGNIVTADGPDAGLLLSGTKAWCSGATLLTHALVTARRGDERLLCRVELDHPGVVADPDTWAAAGMRRADTRTVHFSSAPATAVGPPGSYLDRPGFWIGGIGVAACWYGGAAGLAEPLWRRVSRHPEDAHAAAHLGAVDVALGAARDVLRSAAAAVDADPHDSHARLARRARSTVADTATLVATRVGRALGPGPLATDADHAQRVADLEVYVRQDHAERDLAALGADVAADKPDWSL